MESTMDDLENPASTSRSSAPAGGRHLAVLGHFRTDSDYSVTRPHGAASWLLTWTIDGSGQLAHAGRATTATPGDLVVLGPDVAQRYASSPDGWAFWWCHFQPRPAWTSLLTPWRVGPALYRATVVEPSDRTRIADTFRRALADLAPPGTVPGDETIHVSSVGTTDLVLNAVEEVLLVAARSTELGVHEQTGDAIDAAERAIGRDPTARYTVASLAAVAAMSPSHFAHEFTRRTGRPPMRAVRDERIALATTLLRTTSLAVGQVARASGFDDPFYFSRVFRRQIGVAPSVYAAAARARQE
jgi:AraC family transcriptional regulator of arabinose operon